MARSVGSRPEMPGGSVTHKLSGSVVQIRNGKRGMVHTLNEGGLTASYEAPYYVGSGQVGRSFLVRIGDYLFQSPVSYYTKARRWDLTPGYEVERRLDFTHEIVPGCLFCHTGEVRLQPGVANRYEDPPFTPISCERCHGLGAEHVRQPSAKNIVNPAKVATRARDSICEQCHLEGAVRILNPGKDWWDFHAGDELESVFSAYLETSAAGQVRAVSHVEQLAQSKCARASGGQLSCITCHDPHGDPGIDRGLQIKGICQRCHAQLSAASHPAGVQQCTSCHMPARPASDVAHAAITDHRIQRPGFVAGETPGVLRSLVAWHEPPASFKDRNFALGELAVAEKERSADLALEAFRRLMALAQAGSTDPELRASTASMLLQQKRPKDALRLFLEAGRLAPRNASYALYTSIAYEACGDDAGAISSLKSAIRIDPSLERPYFELAKIYRALGQEPARTQVIRQYLKLFPESIAGRLALAN